MITIVEGQCTGCGACVEVCPTGALYLVDGRAAVDNALCRECEACVSACPTEAIRLITGPINTPDRAPVPVLRREPEVVLVRTSPAQPAPLPLRSALLPALGAALSWTRREIMPRLADLLIERLDRAAAPAANRSTGGGQRGGSGRRQDARGGRGRRRQRWGGGHR